MREKEGENCDANLSICGRVYTGGRSFPIVVVLSPALRTDPGERALLGSILARLAMFERLEAGGAAAAREHMEEAVTIGG